MFSGGNASSVPFRAATLFGLALTDQRTYYFVVLAVLAVSSPSSADSGGAGVGRVTLAVRDNSTTAAAYTVRPALRSSARSRWPGSSPGSAAGCSPASPNGSRSATRRFAVAGSLLLVSR